MISVDLIARMKSTAFLINTGRGAVVDEIALADALDAGCINGAALDVFSVEPLPQDYRLMRTRNLILTPHSIGTPDEMYTEYMDYVEQAIRQVLSGQTPETAVNVPRSRG